MKKRVTYIPTLQEYAKKRKKEHARFLEISNCVDCQYFRKDLEVCLWDDNVRIISALSCCPVTQRAIQ